MKNYYFAADYSTMFYQMKSVAMSALVTVHFSFLIVLINDKILKKNTSKWP